MLAEPLIVLAAVVSGIQAGILGYSYDEIMKEIATKISKVWGALLILVIVGFMIGIMDAWRHNTYAYIFRIEVNKP